MTVAKAAIATDVSPIGNGRLKPSVVQCETVVVPAPPAPEQVRTRLAVPSSASAAITSTRLGNVVREFADKLATAGLRAASQRVV